MAFVLSNYFSVLAEIDEELDHVSKITPDALKKAPTSLPDSRKQTKKQQQAAAKKKQETKPDAAKMRAKPISVGQDHVNRREITQTPGQKPNFDAIPKQQQREEVIEKELSLKEYKKQLLEKKKGSNTLNRPDEEKKISLDMEFESMKLLKSDKDQAKLPKTVDVSGILKPQNRKGRSFPAVNTVTEQGSDKMKTELNIEDLDQFPALN